MCDSCKMLLTAGPGEAGLGYGSSLTEQLNLHLEFLVFLGDRGVLGSGVRERPESLSGYLL